MKCDQCQVKEFVHADLYCQACPDKPVSPIKTGSVYLFLKGKFEPLASVDIKAPEDIFYDVAVVELFKKLRVELIA